MKARVTILFPIAGGMSRELLAQRINVITMFLSDSLVCRRQFKKVSQFEDLSDSCDDDPLESLGLAEDRKDQV
tara:strand:- start:275 stop:493 length:219 start_codon:yes stop_codon:yes gene_type:complete